MTTPITTPRKFDQNRVATIALLMIFLIILFVIHRTGMIVTLDQSIEGWVSAHVDTSWRPSLILLTTLGKSSLLAAFMALIAGGLWLRCQKSEARVFAGGFIALALTVTLVKTLVARPRPEAAALVNATSGSFPSSHAALSLFVYGFGTLLLSRHLASPLGRLAIIYAGFGLAVSIAASRILLNAHWLTDVLGGLVLAAMTLLVCVRQLRSLA